MKRQRLFFLLGAVCFAVSAFFGTQKLALTLRTQPELLGLAWRYLLLCLAFSGAGALLMFMSRRK